MIYDQFIAYGMTQATSRKHKVQGSGEALGQDSSAFREPSHQLHNDITTLMMPTSCSPGVALVVGNVLLKSCDSWTH